MTAPASSPWTFVSTGRLREDFVTQLLVPAQTPSVSLIETFLGPGHSAAETPRIVLDLPPRVLSADLLVMRDAPDGASIAPGLGILSSNISAQLGVRPAIGILRFPESGGNAPLSVQMLTGMVPTDSQFMRQLRALELYGHLVRTAAIYEAQDAHYQLPSGVHAGRYIRVADAFDDPLVAVRLADWLEHRVRDQTLLLADSWTLMPLLLELSSRRTDGPNRHRVVAFPEYPSPALVQRVLELVSTEAASLSEPHVLFITSVVGTGNFLKRITAAARRTLPNVEFETIVLVSAQAAEPTEDVVLALPETDGGSSARPQRAAIHLGEPCLLCQDPKRSPVILIDQRKYFPHVQVSHQEFMVSPADAVTHSRFWELASRCNAIGVHVEETTRGRPRHLHVDVRAHRILSDESYAADLSDRLTNFIPQCDLVLIPSNLSTESLRQVARNAFPNAAQFVVQRGQLELSSGEPANIPDIRDALRPQLRGVARILLLDEVLVTGGTLRSLHRLVQETIGELRGLPKDQQPIDDYRVAAFVVVARPHDQQQWLDLVASFMQERTQVRLASNQCVVLPTGSCPWCEEQVLLDGAASLLRRMRRDRRHQAVHNVRANIEARLDILRTSAASPNRGLDANLFVCGRHGEISPRAAETITAHSLFGESLGEATAYAAMATAVGAVRERASEQHGPREGRTWSWRLHKLVNAYHDPLLQAAFLRAVRRTELLGVDRARTSEAIKEVLFESKTAALRQSALLAGEHALAAIQDKFPLDMKANVLAAAESVLEEWNSPMSAVVRALVSLLSLRQEGAI